MELLTSELLDGNISPLTEERKKELYSVFTQYASEGKRVLAMAYKDFQKHKAQSTKQKEGCISIEEAENDLVFVGFTAMMDPPRPEVAPAITECQEAGIRVIMITGDSELTAGAVGTMIGLTGETLDATKLAELTDEELTEKLQHVSIFSRIAPQDKLRIIRLLKAQ